MFKSSISTESLRSTRVHKQRGAATLLVTVILLVGITLISLYASKVGVLDQRISGNEYRHKEAFANAEAGLEQAASFLDGNISMLNPVTAAGSGWVACGASTPCTDVTGATFVYTVPVIAATDRTDAYIVKTSTNTVAVGVGQSEDNTGAAIVQTAYAKANVLTSGELPPLMLPSGDLSGNFNIVPNPNGGGPGVPISVWAKDTLDTSGANWKTCDQGEFKDGSSVCMDTKSAGTSLDWLACQCDTERSNSTDVSEDIVLDDASEFPASPFAYLFDGKSQQEIKDQAEDRGILYEYATCGDSCCDTLAADIAGLARSAIVWVEGSCNTGSNALIGSRDSPIILVVEGDLRINANSEFWGIIMGLGDIYFNGGPVIHGAAISETSGELTNGTYSQVYDQSVFDNLKDDDINSLPAKVKYSWRDF